jgi:glycyl-tRNA synthetase (class II)
MSQLTITCPSCNEAFSADQTLQNHLKNKKQKYQEETKVKERFLKERNLEKKLALKAQNESEAKVQALRLKVLEAESERYKRKNG